MSMTTKIRAVNNDGSDVDLRASDGGILYTMPQAVAWTLKGYGWHTMAVTATASLVIRPSTLSALTLYNNTSSKVFVIERVFAHNLVAAAQCVSVIWLCVHPVGANTPTGNNIAIRNSSSGLTAGAEGICDTAEAVADNGWFPWGQDSTVVTVTTPGGVLEANVNGKLVVPSLGSISVTVVSSVTTATFCCGFHYYSVPDDELDVN